MPRRPWAEPCGYALLDAEDDIGYDMRQHLDAASAFIQAAYDAGGQCLVHCQAGINRSVFIVVAELMVREQRTLDLERRDLVPARLDHVDARAPKDAVVAVRVAARLLNTRGSPSECAARVSAE